MGEREKLVGESVSDCMVIGIHLFWCLRVGDKVSEWRKTYHLKLL